MAGVVWDEDTPPRPTATAGPKATAGPLAPPQAPPPPSGVAWDPPTAMDRVRAGAGAVRDAITQVVAKAGQYTPLDVVQMGLSQITSPRQTLSGLVTGEPSRGLVPMPQPLVSDEQATDYAKVLVPQTGGQLGADLALAATGLGPVGKVLKLAKAGPLVRRVVPAATRIGAAGVGGATGGALAGEDPVAEGTKGVLGAGLGEGVGAARTLAPAVVRRAGKVAEKVGLREPVADVERHTTRTLADVTTRMVRDMQASQEAARVGQAMGTLMQQTGVPGLSAQTQDDLYRLARSGKGKEALDQAFGQAKDIVTQRLKGRKLYVPEFGSESRQVPSSILDASGAPAGQRNVRTGLLTLDEALTELQNAGKGITQQTGLQRSVGARQASLRYGEAREALLKAVAAVDTQAAELLDRALTGYRQGRAYIALLDKSLDASGRLDPRKLAANVNKAAEKLKRAYGARWPQAEAALTGGRGVPTPVPPPYRAQPPAPSPKALPQLRPGTQLGLDMALQAPPLMLPGLGAAAMLAGPLLRHTPGVRGLHVDEVLDTLEAGL